MIYAHGCFFCWFLPPGPTALGLTTTLLSLKLTKKQIRTRLFLFSIAAPLGAVITYMIVKAVGAGQGGHRADEVDAIGWWTGVVLLFSVSRGWKSFPGALANWLMIVWIFVCKRVDRSFTLLLSSPRYPTRTHMERINMRIRDITRNRLRN